MTDRAQFATRHRRLPLIGRDPDEAHRSATPLELFYDLTFVVAFARSGEIAAELIAHQHFAAALAGFSFTVFAICWAWVSFAWFASGYDNDDWIFRVTTMLQMVGVIVLALGIPQIFESIDRGEPLDNRVAVAGYVVMRIALVLQWLRAARNDPAHRRGALINAVTIFVAQLGWVALAIVRTDDLPMFLFAIAVLYVIETGGPALAKRNDGAPWHAHHIAERYGLLLIITLGEVVSGTVAAVAATVGRVGWSLEAALVVIAGIGISFGIWWSYFVIPFGELLARHRDRSWIFGYGHIFVFASVAAVGVGLEVAAHLVEGEATLGETGAVLAVAIPIATGTLAYFAVYSLLVRAVDPFHLVLVAGTLVMLALGVVLSLGGASLGWCLVVLMTAPFVMVAGYEALGHRHVARLMAAE